MPKNLSCKEFAPFGQAILAPTGPHPKGDEEGLKIGSPGIILLSQRRDYSATRESAETCGLAARL